jgi:hypothetical protein
MLTALDTGVKGGQWFSLIDKAYRRQNLFAAFRKVAANGGAAGVDHVSIERFEEGLLPNLKTLSDQLQNGTYRPQEIRRQYILKPGSKELRPLEIPTVRDRVVQTALRNVLEPIFERDFAEQSYGFRPGRGCKDALARVDTLLKIRLHARGGCRLEELFRHDPARSFDGVDQKQNQRRAGTGTDSDVSETTGTGRPLDPGTRKGQPAGGGHQSVAQQHLSRPA